MLVADMLWNNRKGEGARPVRQWILERLGSRGRYPSQAWAAADQILLIQCPSLGCSPI
jgi:hypothetical protein